MRPQPKKEVYKKATYSYSQNWDAMELTDQINYLENYCKRINDFYRMISQRKQEPKTRKKRDKMLKEILFVEKRLQGLTGLQKLLKINDKKIQFI